MAFDRLAPGVLGRVLDSTPRGTDRHRLRATCRALYGAARSAPGGVSMLFADPSPAEAARYPLEAARLARAVAGGLRWWGSACADLRVRWLGRDTAGSETPEPLARAVAELLPLMAQGSKVDLRVPGNGPVPGIGAVHDRLCSLAAIPTDFFAERAVGAPGRVDAAVLGSITMGHAQFTRTLAAVRDGRAGGLLRCEHLRINQGDEDYTRWRDEGVARENYNAPLDWLDRALASGDIFAAFPALRVVCVECFPQPCDETDVLASPLSTPRAPLPGKRLCIRVRVFATAAPAVPWGRHARMEVTGTLDYPGGMDEIVPVGVQAERRDLVRCARLFAVAVRAAEVELVLDDTYEALVLPAATAAIVRHGRSIRVPEGRYDADDLSTVFPNARTLVVARNARVCMEALPRGVSYLWHSGWGGATAAEVSSALGGRSVTVHTTCGAARGVLGISVHFPEDEDPDFAHVTHAERGAVAELSFYAARLVPRRRGRRCLCGSVRAGRDRVASVLREVASLPNLRILDVIPSAGALPHTRSLLQQMAAEPHRFPALRVVCVSREATKNEPYRELHAAGIALSST